MDKQRKINLCNRERRGFLIGFTLIELLVVISIIGLLMAILIPIIRRAKGQTKTVVCRMNLRQYGIAGRMYLNDNEDYFPHPKEWLYSKETLDASGVPHWCQWHCAKLVPDGSLWPYLKAKKCHMCPTFRHLSKLVGQSHPHHDDSSIPIEPQYSYSMNGYLGRERPFAILKQSQLIHPQNTFFFSEENMWLIEDLSIRVLNDTCLCVGAGDALATYHNPPGQGISINAEGYGTGSLTKGSANVVFVDGHVELVHVGVENVENGFKISVPNNRWNESFQSEYPP